MSDETIEQSSAPLIEHLIELAPASCACRFGGGRGICCRFFRCR